MLLRDPQREPAPGRKCRVFCELGVGRSSDCLDEVNGWLGVMMLHDVPLLAMVCLVRGYGPRWYELWLSLSKLFSRLFGSRQYDICANQSHLLKSTKRGRNAGWLGLYILTFQVWRPFVCTIGHGHEPSNQMMTAPPHRHLPPPPAHVCPKDTRIPN